MIRSSILYLLAAIVGLFIQATIVHSSMPAAAAPDFIAVLVIILAITHRNVPGLFGAFLLGIVADLASGEFLGPNAAGCLVVFAIVAVVASRVFADHLIAVVVLTFVCSVAKSLTVVGMYTLYINNALFTREVMRLVLWEALFSALVAPFLLKILLNGRKSSAARSTGTGTFRWSEVK